MQNSKSLYLITLMFLGFMLYTQWQKDYTEAPKQQQGTTTTSTTTVNPVISPDTPPQAVDSDLPIPSQSLTQQTDLPSSTQTAAQAQVIATVETPLLKLQFAAKGAALVYAELKDYPVKKYAEQKVVLLDHRQGHQFKMDSGLLSGQVNFSHNDVFSIGQANWVIDSSPQSITFTAQKAEGVVRKTYTIDPSSYAIEVSHQVTNQTGNSWTMLEYQQLKRNNPWLNEDPSFTDASRYSFKGAGYFDSEDGYETLSFEDMQEQKVGKTIGHDNWIAMVQHYFFAGMISKEAQVEMQTEFTPNATHPYTIRYLTPARNVAAGQTVAFDSTWYVGPKLQNNLPAVARGLDLTVDYGVFTAISKPLFWVLEKIHGFVGNWGWAIVLLTVLIKLLFFKLSEAQYKSMARMRQLQPRLAILKERYKDDKAKFNQEMMGLYQKEKVNPLGGCLPMLIQIPVFIALYWVLLESVELRQAPFIFWLQDLSSPDPYFILPAINAAAMIMTQRLSPTPGMDPMQQKMMKFMPVAFSVLFAFFQSGLVLYWAVNSVLSLAQQWVITRRIEAQETR